MSSTKLTPALMTALRRLALVSGWRSVPDGVSKTQVRALSKLDLVQIQVSRIVNGNERSKVWRVRLTPAGRAFTELVYAECRPCGSCGAQALREIQEMLEEQPDIDC